jgi:hypothetical protein
MAPPFFKKVKVESCIKIYKTMSILESIPNLLGVPTLENSMGRRQGADYDTYICRSLHSIGKEILECAAPRLCGDRSQKLITVVVYKFSTMMQMFMHCSSCHQLHCLRKPWSASPGCASEPSPTVGCPFPVHEATKAVRNLESGQSTLVFT